MEAVSRIAVVHHNRELGLGRLEPVLADHPVTHVWAPDAEFPDQADAVVMMGGFMGAHETDSHPWLAEEKRWLAKRVAGDTPVLGICLGAQLLADALGGRAFTAPRPEVGVADVRLTGAGSRHPVASRLGPRAFFAHQDTFEVPPEGTLLATTEEYPAVFELGSALGVQFHPETPADEALRWADDPGFDLLERAGIAREDYAREVREHEAEAEEAAADLFEAWFGTLR